MIRAPICRNALALTRPCRGRAGLNCTRWIHHDEAKSAQRQPKTVNTRPIQAQWVGNDNKPAEPSKAGQRKSVPVTAAARTMSGLLEQFNDLSIYNAGTVHTTLSGFARVASIFGFVYGTLAVAPIFVFDSLLTTLWAPVIALASGIPMALTALFAAPFVSTIRLSLPKDARRSIENVLSYARRLPPDTKLTLQTMRWLPWPVKSVVRFDELRRLPEGSHSANLTIQPAGEVKAKQRADLEKRPLVAMLMKRMYSRLYVNRQQAQDRSSAPGVLDVIWEQIPYMDEEAAEETVVKSVVKTTQQQQRQLVAAARPVKRPAPKRPTKD